MNGMANISGISGSGSMTGMSGMNRMHGMGRGGNDSSAKYSLQYLRHIMNSVDDPALPRVPLHINL